MCEGREEVGGGREGCVRGGRRCVRGGRSWVRERCGEEGGVVVRNRNMQGLMIHDLQGYCYHKCMLWWSRYVSLASF